MIKIENLTKRYGNKYALSGISFEVNKGEIVGFLGPNGAGKSTTMNILTGFLSFTDGKVEINGLDILDYPDEAKKNIGYLPEQPPLYLDMTVSEYLNFIYDLKGCKLNRKKHIAEIIEVVRLTDVRGRLIGNLSKGYRQRVGIGQALVGNPQVIILDEPTVGLDPRQVVEIRNLIRTLGLDHTVILSTHILSEVQAVCDRVIIINKGKIVADRKTDGHRLRSQRKPPHERQDLRSREGSDLRPAFSSRSAFRRIGRKSRCRQHVLCRRKRKRHRHKEAALLASFKKQLADDRLRNRRCQP